MERYIISIKKSDLFQKADFAFEIGEENGMLYYLCESGELEGVIDRLLSHTERGGPIMVQKANRENIPPNLRQEYQEFFKNLSQINIEI